LPRLSGSSEAEILEASVSLREVQHVIAREYDLKNWEVLQAIVPPEPEGGAPREYSPRLLKLASRRFDEYTEDEFVEFWVEASRQTHASGLLSFVDLLDRIATPHISEGLRLAMDGTEIDLVWDTIETRQDRVLYPREETRRLMVQEAVLAAMQGDSPLVVEYKLGAFFVDEPDGKSDLSHTSLPDLQTRLQETPYAQMTFEQISDLFKGMIELWRRQDRDALVPLIECADHPFLKHSLELMLSSLPHAEVLDALRELIDVELQEIKIRYRMVLLGVKALQTLKEPKEMASFLREGARSHFEREREAALSY
jgi:flagellar motor component MotA